MPRSTPSLKQTQIQRLRLNTALASSIRILRFDASGLTRYLEEQARDNPFLTLETAQPAPGEWLPRWTTAFASQGLGDAGSPDVGAFLQAPALGLLAHVSRQIDQLFPPGRPRNIAFALMQSLEPSGWLGRPLGNIAAEFGCTVPEAEAVLTRLHAMEPTGLFARSLAECLHLQAEERGLLDRLMGCILDHLDLLAAGQTARLARMCDVPESDVIKTVRIIRSFDPKPGAQFGHDAAPVREPDLTISRGPYGWQVSLNRSALPDLHVRDTAASSDDAEEASEKRQQARELQRIVTSRNHTLMRITQEILKRQEAILSQGMTALQPMTMREVGVAVALHESTISRAIAGVSVDTPRETIWLRSLFTAAPAGDGGASAGALRSRLLKLIQTEDAFAPFSDQALAVALSTETAKLARRTVAKYRAMMDVPPAHRRKQRR
uniref:RNA polymerase factor sigma-54 n=1 Tax=Pseudorhodobacter sp. TaxID=1934400 RepID=UPI0026484066|nr:RNA polymerase factor sigma-54 [Pseudorhodobacter sp.]MDN5786903.1 RNA polymerase factor sigma-54 [Pseudorhodobacter sp.]